MIEILSAGAQTTVQDQGRLGYLRYGVGTAGAMDRVALRSANLWLGNDENAAAIEVPSYPFEFKSLSATRIAISGADVDVWVDGVALSPWIVMSLRPGQVVRIGTPLRYARCYVAIAGGFDVPVLLGSRSTAGRGEFGGFEGRALMSGDRLPSLDTATVDSATGITAPYVGFVAPAGVLPGAGKPENNVHPIRILPAGEYASFTDTSIETFWNTAWKITMQSNRAGYRLAGATLQFRRTIEMRSHGIVPGVIQVPPSGAPIIQLSDAHTAGGYPKIGTVIEADLWRVGQAPLGSRLQFVKVDYDTALAALEDIEHYLKRLRRDVLDASLLSHSDVVRKEDRHA